MKPNIRNNASSCSNAKSHSNSKNPTNHASNPSNCNNPTQPQMLIKQLRFSYASQGQSDLTSLNLLSPPNLPHLPPKLAIFRLNLPHLPPKLAISAKLISSPFRLRRTTTSSNPFELDLAVLTRLEAIRIYHGYSICLNYLAVRV
jgi:hypothetical protein